GNPLFLTQLLYVAAAEELEGPVSRLTSTLLAPDAVREAIGVHLQALSSACRHALSVASVFGPEFRLRSLSSAMQASPADVLSRVDEGCQGRFIAAAPGSRDGFTFLHAVVRDVLYRQWSVADKARWHRAVAEAMAEMYDAGAEKDPLPVARHFVLGAAM